MTLFLEASQISLEEFEEQDEVLEYYVNKDGSIEVADGQMDLEDIKEVDEDPEKSYHLQMKAKMETIY